MPIANISKWLTRTTRKSSYGRCGERRKPRPGEGPNLEQSGPCAGTGCAALPVLLAISRVMTNRDISLVVSRWAPWPLSLELQPLFPSPEWRQCTIGWITRNVLFVPASYLLREDCGSMDVWILIPLLSDASQHFLRVICLSYFPGGLSDVLCIFSIKNVKFLLQSCMKLYALSKVDFFPLCALQRLSVFEVSF